MADVAAYLSRVGYQGTTAPTLETLQGLHEAHVGAVIFENVNALSGLPINLDGTSLEDKIVRQGRGGYCFELNLLFGDLLREMGFVVTPLIARVWMGARSVRPRSHSLLKVDIDGEPWIADVGFGGTGLLEPIPLRAGAEVELPLVSFRLQQEGGLWVMQSSAPTRWFDLYGFTLEPQERVDYEAPNYFIATHPSSPFTKNLVLAKVERTRRIRMVNRQLTIMTETGVEERQLASGEEVAAIARDLLNLEIAPDIVPDAPPAL